MLLQEMRIGQSGIIKKICGGEKTFRHKLIAMGLLPGTKITVSRIAPLGDPVEINLRGYLLSLRKYEANILDIEPI